MIRRDAIFTNENGLNVHMTVEITGETVHVTINNSVSRTEHTWTRIEAAELRSLLS